MAARSTAQLSAREARWLAIGAQRLARPRPKSRVTRARIAELVGAIGIVQLDAVNVLERTQFVVVFSRLGAYDRVLLYQLTRPGGALWEYWGHAASLMPTADEPLLRWRYAIGSTYVPGPTIKARIEAWEANHADYLATVMEEVRENGPLSAGQLVDPRRRTGEWWDRRSLGREALARLAGRGRLVVSRTPSFESVYDVPERMLPAAVLGAPTPPTDDAQKTLLLRAARASGVGTVKDLAGYYMIQPKLARPLVADLVHAGELAAVDVEGWGEPGYVVAGTEPHRPTRATATLLSPFDSLIWDRARTRRMFGFEYQIEIYVPQPKRIHGYYVLPVLLGDQLVARLDLKADRKASVLRVAGAFREHGTDRETVATAVATELDSMREWLQLDDISIARKGDLAAALATEVARR